MLELLKQSSDPSICQSLLASVKAEALDFIKKNGRAPIFMEVCGSHTMALAKTGLKKALNDEVRLISGPGCPVCVTDQHSIDCMIALSDDPARIICTFGDMVRVPGSGKTLLDAKTAGSDIRILYSPVDAVRIAAENPEKEIIFLGIGFETTIPILALLIAEAEKLKLNNFSIWMAAKLVPPILRELMSAGDIKLDGFLLPGHVSIVTGEEFFEFLPVEYSVPGVISGFEIAEMLSAICKLLKLCNMDEAKIINDHPSVVRRKGNAVAQSYMQKYFCVQDEVWRGIGTIPESGLGLKPEYSKYDAKKRYSIPAITSRKTKCRCGEVIRGMIEPMECSLFGKACRPMNPIGPCMVSDEGSCSAYYNYMREKS